MRFLFTVTAMLMLAACGANPQPVAAPSSPVVAEPVRERGDLIGMDANDLATRLGRPRLQVREGNGTKLQFAGGSCLLDAYLYPGSGGPRVTHVDTRNREGRVVDQAACIAMIEQR